MITLSVCFYAVVGVVIGKWLVPGTCVVVVKPEFHLKPVHNLLFWNAMKLISKQAMATECCCCSFFSI